MKLVPLAGLACGTTQCPTIYATEGDDLVIQGYAVPAQRDGQGAPLPEGEIMVRIPRHLLLEAASMLPRDTGE